MKILCVVGHLPFRGEGIEDWKSDLYSRAVAMHGQIGAESSLFCLRGASRGERLLEDDEARILAAELGARWVPNKFAGSMLPLVHGKGASKVNDARRERIGQFLPSLLLPSLLWPDAHHLRRYKKLIPERPWHGFLYNFQSCLATLEAICENGARPDIVAALDSCKISGWFAHALHRITGVPYVVWEHKTIYQRGGLKDRDWTLTRDTLASARGILPVSPQLGHAMQKAVGIREPKKYRAVPNPIPDRFFKSPPSKATDVVAFAAGRTIFAAWTEWRKQKRLDVLLDAFQIVCSKHNKFCLVVAGGHPPEAIAMVKERRLERQVLLLGRLNRDGVWRLAHTCASCIVSSDAETFGLPVIEAMAAGRPVVATRCGGPEEIINDCELGQTVKPNNATALANAIEYVGKKISSYDGAHISATCRNRFGESAVTEIWKSVYRKLGY